MKAMKAPRGATRLGDGRGSTARFSESYPLLITDSCRHTHSYEEFWGNLPISYSFLPILENPPMFEENLPKKGPLLRESLTQNPPIWAGHTRILKMLYFHQARKHHMNESPFLTSTQKVTKCTLLADLTFYCE